MSADRVKKLFYEKLEAAEGPEHPWAQKRVKVVHTENEMLRNLLHRSLAYVTHYKSCQWQARSCTCGLSAWLNAVDQADVCDCTDLALAPVTAPQEQS